MTAIDQLIIKHKQICMDAEPTSLICKKIMLQNPKEQKPYEIWQKVLREAMAKK
jgi:hypothetical protein